MPDLPSLCEPADHITTRSLQVFSNEQPPQRNSYLVSSCISHFQGSCCVELLPPLSRPATLTQLSVRCPSGGRWRAARSATQPPVDRRRSRGAKLRRASGSRRATPPPPPRRQGDKPPQSGPRAEPRSPAAAATSRSQAAQPSRAARPQPTPHLSRTCAAERLCTCCTCCTHVCMRVVCCRVE